MRPKLGRIFHFWTHEGGMPVRLMFDEFANIALPDGYARLQATMRSRNIMATIILQNISQLKALFKDDWEGIIGNADAFVYLGGNEQSTHMPLVSPRKLLPR